MNVIIFITLLAITYIVSTLLEYTTVGKACGDFVIISACYILLHYIMEAIF